MENTKISAIRQHLTSKGMTTKTVNTYCSILEKVFDKNDILVTEVTKLPKLRDLDTDKKTIDIKSRSSKICQKKARSNSQEI